MSKNKYIFLNGLINLAQSRLGSKIVYKTDEFFAPAKRIINPWPPVFKEGVFDKHGKWMDGWETKRKRGKGYDYLILKLGRPGQINKIDIDTSYFSGNQPTKVSLQACFSKKKLPNKNSKWTTILKKKPTKANSHHFFNIKNKSIFTHIKLNIFPDGGVARIRIYGSMLSTPILNPPQTGVLGMHNIVERPVAKEGNIVIRPIMYLALSYDHRIIDGKEAVSFLKTVKECLEEPRRLFLDL